ncbi:hypothetical protein [Chitinophaga tropicalis]|uniref:Uncharacterized protein n=1 Tax=Chitinophaga tropicalis TaxID=2683588 RepID=A0A7K1UAK1_9BACT|nr:hypothetical protein [Chitinophaga tropicalis]MVT11373.1 hypothetical protein [Chitinophaga tropicalis]
MIRTPEEVMKGGAAIVEAGIKEESRAQGHYLTGAMQNSLSVVAGRFANARVVFGTAVDYTHYVNKGVAAGKIPFQQGSGAGKSAYIEGLRQFFILKGLSDKEALGAAFATAKTHKKEGMPSKGSYAHSSTGQRTGMIETAMRKKEPQLDAHMSTGFDSLVEYEFQKCKSETV